MADAIDAYHDKLKDDSGHICVALRGVIDRHLPDGESKIWHAHPVWFLHGNPIVGYSKLKGPVRLLFWSGQSFTTPGLKPEGKFKAAEARYQALTEVDEDLLGSWLDESRMVQWDYKTIAKKRGQLDRLL